MKKNVMLINRAGFMTIKVAGSRRLVPIGRRPVRGTGWEVCPVAAGVYISAVS